MTIMTDEDEDSDRLYMDEREEVVSPNRPKTSDDQNTGTENIAPDFNNKTSELRNTRKAKPPPVNYLPLMGNFTLNRIKNNILNASEEKPRITIKDFARIPDESNSNDIGDSALHALLASNANPLGDIEQYTTIPMGNEALRAEAQNNDPRLYIAETCVPNSNAYKATAGPDYQRAPESYINTPQDQRIPAILQNPFEVQNENIPRIPGAPSMNANMPASVIIPSAGSHSGGTITYGLTPVQYNRNTNLTVSNSCTVQNCYQSQYTEAYGMYGNFTASKYNGQATANLNRIRCTPYNCPLMNKSANHPSNPYHNPMIRQHMYSKGMTCNGQMLVSTNPHIQVPIPNSQKVPWSYEQSFNKKLLPPPNTPYGDRDTAAYFAEMHKQTLRMESLRTSRVINASGQANQKKGLKTTKKRSYTKINTNTTQVVMNSQIPASSIYNNVTSNSVNIPNCWEDFGLEETTARKQPAYTNVNISKPNASMPVNNHVNAPLNMGIQPISNHFETPSIDVTSAYTHNFHNYIQPSLNLTTMRTNTPKANIVSHYIDVAGKIQAPISKEDNLQPLTNNINSDGVKTVLMETPQGAVNISMNRDNARIPLITDYQANISMDTDKTLAEMPNSVHQSQATTDTTTEKLQNGTFLQPPNINRQVAPNLLNNDNSRAQTDATSIPKTLQASSNAYDVKLCRTYTTTEKIPHITENNAVLTSATNNGATESIRETTVTTVGTVNQISSISIETLKEILINAQQIPTKAAAFDYKSNDDQVRKCDHTGNYNVKTIANTTAGNHTEPNNDHKTQDMIDSKKDVKFEIARRNLARLRAAEHHNEDSSYIHVGSIAQKDSENQFRINIPTGLNGEYIAQVISVSCDGSSMEKEHFQVNYSANTTKQTSTSDKENISHSQNRQDIEVLDTNKSIENNQDINEASESTDNIRNETRDATKDSIDETLFFTFQIHFFRRVQEKLSKNNCHKFADELSKDIYDLITGSEDDGAKADMKYKCPVCRNVTTYSPRSLYYKISNHQENFVGKVQNCTHCITFRKKYIEILKKYIESEALNERANISQIIRDDAITDATENSKHYQGDDIASKQNENSDIENRLSLIINGVPPSPKKAKIGEQTDISQTKQGGNTNDFVVKLPRNRIKQSIIKALMQRKNMQSNAIKPGREEATLNIALRNKANNNSENSELGKNIITKTATSTITEQCNRNVNKSTNNSIKETGGVRKTIDAAICRMYSTSNNDNREETLGQTKKSISAKAATGTISTGENRNSDPASGNKQDNNINPEKHRKKTISSSTELSTDANLEPQNQNINSTLNNDNSDKSKEKRQKIRKSTETILGRNFEPQLRKSNATLNEDSDTEKTHEKRYKKRKSISFVNSNPGIENGNATSNNGHSENSKETHPKIWSVETASIINLNHNRHNNGHNDNNQEGHRKKKSTSAESSTNPEHNRNNSEDNDKDESNRKARKSIDLTTATTAERPNVKSNLVSHNKDDNNMQRNHELSESIDKETLITNKTNTISDAISTETNKRTESAKHSQITANAEKNASNKKREKAERKHNDDTIKKVPGANQDESCDNVIQIVGKALEDHFKTLKDSCNTTEEELPQVEITGKKKNKKTSSKSKEHQPFEEIKYKYRCKVCTVSFKYLSPCLSHMNKNHLIQNPVVPLHCITMRCAFCPVYVMPDLYNTHVKNAHDDKFTQKDDD